MIPWATPMAALHDARREIEAALAQARADSLRAARSMARRVSNPAAPTHDYSRDGRGDIRWLRDCRRRVALLQASLRDLDAWGRA